MQRLDGHAAPPDARDARAALRRAGRAALAANRRPRRRRSAPTSSGCSSPDGVLAGFAYFRDAGGVGALAAPARPRHRHPLPPAADDPRDHRRPVHAASRPSGTSSSSGAICSAADGARLFDRPIPYRGGLQRHFQRAESSTFFGREIGLMYTHAHLRYAEAMARFGDADALLRRAPAGEPDRSARGRAERAASARRTATRRAPTRPSPTATRPPRATTTSGREQSRSRAAGASTRAARASRCA